MGVCFSRTESIQQKELQNFIKECFPDSFEVKYRIIASLNIRSLEVLNEKIRSQQYFPINFSDDQTTSLLALVEGKLLKVMKTQINFPLSESKPKQGEDNIYIYPNSFKINDDYNKTKQIIFFGTNNTDEDLTIGKIIDTYLGKQFLDIFEYEMTPFQHYMLRIYQIKEEIIFIYVVGFDGDFLHNRVSLQKIYDSLKELQFNPDLVFFVAPFSEKQLSSANIQLIQGIFEIFENNIDSISRLRVILTNYDSGELILTAYQTEESVFRQLTYLINQKELYFGVNTNFSQKQLQLQFRENNYKTIQNLTDYIKKYQHTGEKTSILSVNFIQRNIEYFQIIEYKEKLKQFCKQLKVDQYNLTQIELIEKKYTQQEVDLEQLKTESIDYMDIEEKETSYFIDEFFKDIIQINLNEQEEQTVMLNSAPLLQMTGTIEFQEQQGNIIIELQRLKSKLNNYCRQLRDSIKDKDLTFNIGKQELIKRTVQYQASTPWPCYGLSMNEIDKYLKNDNEIQKWLYF